MPDLDDQINSARADLEQRDLEARKLEQRLRQIPGLDFRDQDSDSNALGLPPASVDHFWNQELPQLMQRPEVRVFAQERIAELRAKSAELRQRIERQVGSLMAEEAAAEQEAARINAVMQEVSP